jgi:hypothetical protein
MPKVLLFPINDKPQVLDIAAGLKPMQALVGGNIEHVALEGGIGLVCNEEGKLNGLPRNRPIPEINDVIRGPFFISRYNNEGETVDITDADVTKYSARYP